MVGTILPNVSLYSTGGIGGLPLPSYYHSYIPTKLVIDSYIVSQIV